MNTVHEGLNVICKTSDKAYELMCAGYDENLDEIKVRTVVKENELQRGWIGDLYYSTNRSRDIKTGEDTEFIAENTYKDVLLARVNIWDVDDGVVTWEYTFLKK